MNAKVTMKCVALLTGGLLLPLGEAIADNWQLGANIGAASGDTSASALNNQLSSQGLSATASSNDDNRMAWKLYVGYQHTATWGMEFGYVDLGKINTTIDGTTADINTFLTSVADIHPQTAQGWTLSGTYRHPFSATNALLLRAGVYDWSSDYQLKSAGISRTVNSDGTSGIFGLGFETKVGSGIMLTFDYARYSIDGESILVLSAGTSYRFK